MKKLNYRHYVCIAITIAFVCTTVFVFPHAFGRIIESIRDFGLSVAYYFCELLHIPYDFEPTVNSYSQTPFFPFLENYETPITTLPETWDGFVVSWEKYWQQWASKENFFNYIKAIGDVLYNISYFLLMFLPLIFVIIIIFNRYLKTENNNYDKDSKPLTIFKKLSDRIYRPVKIWISSFLTFLAEHKAYTLTWLVLWLFNFNIFTIVIEFLAFYFYFVISFDFLSIYKQVYKLCLDLWTAVNFIPVPVWIIIGLLIVNKCATNIAYARLRHRDRRASFTGWRAGCRARSDLSRVTGQSVIVESLSSTELEKYPLKSNGEKIPTLKETLALIDGRAPLNRLANRLERP